MNELQQAWQTALDQIVFWGPRILIGIVLVVVGWVLAKLVQSLARSGARRLGIDRPVESMEAEGEDKVPPTGRPSHLIGVFAFWIVMLFVITGFLTAVNLGSIATPFTGILEQIGYGLPRFLIAVALVAIGYFLAKFSKTFTVRGLKKLDIDNRLKGIGVEGEKQAEQHVVAQTIGWVVFAVVAVIFLQATLEVLGLSLLAGSVQNLVGSMTEMIPALINAVVVMGVAVLIAFFVRPIVASFLNGVGVDSFAQKHGIGREGDERPVSTPLAHATFWIIILFTLPAALAKLGLDPIVEPLQNAWDRTIASLPNLFAAALIVGVGVLVIKIVGPLVQSLLQGIGFDALLSRMGLHKLHVATEADEKRRPSYISAVVIVSIIGLLLAQEALSALGMDYLADMVAEILYYLPNVFVAAAIVGLAMWLGNLVKGLVTDAASNMQGLNANLLGTSAQVAVIVFGSAMAIAQLDIGGPIVETTVLLVIGAACLAGAIALGLGGKPHVERYLDERLGKAGGSSGQSSRPTQF